ncbi:putative nucleolar protein 4-like [Apostichopus japonicus]|uniref:Putative nucleolar protein 4-like n=1 Tax=Stichopus japonicus TaxID=307972 RepID=A0A2G8JFV6_STIJA|nr:putative nucleolar protein 4-like [Apostichopus japonicus]
MKTRPKQSAALEKVNFPLLASEVFFLSLQNADSGISTGSDHGHDPGYAPTRPFEETITKQSTRTVGYHFENGVSASHDPYYVTPQLPTNTQPTTQHTPMTNGPTDLSVKKLSSSKAQLSPTEIANIRQLITSYRESAAFLYRSADELEQMLLQLN